MYAGALYAGEGVEGREEGEGGGGELLALRPLLVMTVMVMQLCLLSLGKKGKASFEVMVRRQESQSGAALLLLDSDSGKTEVAARHCQPAGRKALRRKGRTRKRRGTSTKQQRQASSRTPQDDRFADTYEASLDTSLLGFKKPKSCASSLDAERAASPPLL